MVDSYRPQNSHFVRDAERTRASKRRHREHSPHGYSARDRSGSPRSRRWYESSHYRYSPERRPRERGDDRRYDVPRRMASPGREFERRRPRSPDYSYGRRDGARRRSRSRSPVRARETRRPSRSRSPVRPRESYPAAGSHYRTCPANPARKVKTHDIASSRRNPLRNGEVQPQNDIERQWVMQQLRLKDLAAGRAQPVNGAEAEYVRQNRKSVVEPAKEKVSCESNRMANVEESADVQDESIMIDHDVDFTSPRNPTPPAPVEQQAEAEMLSASQGHSRATTPVRDPIFIGSQEATSPHQSPSAQTVQEQLDFELAQRLQQELNGVPRGERNPERTALDLQEAERQQDEFRQIQRRMARLAKAHISPFAPVLAKFIRYFDEQSQEQATREGTAAKPMTCGARPRSELPGMEQRLKITDILSLEPEETCDERFTNAWLTDFMMDFLAAAVRASPSTDGRKHFVPAQSTLNMWVGRTHWDNGGIISLDQDQIMHLLEKKIADALHHVLHPDQANEKHNFPLADMPKDTESVSLLYNIGDAHWVHILLQVDDEKKKGTITLHNSLDEFRSGKARVSGQRPPKGQTLAAVERELPRLAHLICMRPSLGWQNVKWDPVTTGHCLQQANGSDCGIFAWTCANNLAMGHPVDAVVDAEGHPIFRGRERRWKALSALHFQYFGTFLPDVEEAWLAYGEWKALRENYAAWKAASVNSGVDDDDELAEEDNPPPTGGPRRGTQQSTGMTGEPAAEDHASECNESLLHDDHELDWSDRKRHETLAKVRTKMESSVGQFGFYASKLSSSSTEAHNGSFVSDRTAICDLFQRMRRPLTVDEICAEVSNHIRPLPIPIAPRLAAALESTPNSFYRDHPGDVAWNLCNGVGRSVDTESFKYLLQKDHRLERSVADDILIDYRLTISFGRWSGPRKARAAFAQLDEQAQTLIDHHHCRFSAKPHLPKVIKSMQDVRSGLESPEGCSFAYGMEPRSSSCDILSEPSDEFVRELLTEANSFAAERGTLIPVLFLVRGWDGLSTNNRTWFRLIQRWPNLQFHLTMMVRVDMGCYAQYARTEFTNHQSYSSQVLYWFHYEVTKLAGLFENDITMDEIGQMSSSASDEQTPARIRLSTVEGFQGSEPVEEVYLHAVLLHILAVIDHWKIDCSVFYGFGGNYFTHSDAKHFSRSVDRNSTDLRGTSRVCEISNCSAHAAAIEYWTRGNSSDIAVRCSQHIAGEDQNGTRDQGYRQGEFRLDCNMRRCSLDKENEKQRLHHVLPVPPVIDLRRCKTCGATKPKSAFGTSENAELTQQCQACDDTDKERARLIPVQPDPDLITCAKCGILKPETAFGVRKNGDRNVRCQLCNQQDREQALRHLAKPVPDTEWRCKKCGQSKPMSAFGTFKNGTPKKQCLTCLEKRRAYDKKMRIRNESV